MKLIAFEGAKQSKITAVRDGVHTIVHEGELVYKLHYYEDFEFDQSYLTKVGNEYAVLKIARKQNLKHISPLIDAFLGVDHIAFAMPRYEMTFRDYLFHHRDPRHLNKIFLMIVDGLRELHSNGLW